jgi:hypothetical protein
MRDVIDFKSLGISADGVSLDGRTYQNIHLDAVWYDRATGVTGDMEAVGNLDKNESV